MFEIKKVDLSKMAKKLFLEVFPKIDAETSIINSIKTKNSSLFICGEEINLLDFSEIYVISFGKAGMAMAGGIYKILSDKITFGIVSAPETEVELPKNCQIYNGGHPFPNEESLAAAEASIQLLKSANHKKALIIFLVSGGGSAMLELPKDEKISLEDLQETNKILVNCGATINEVNKFRKAISKVKGGGLSRIAPFARKITLIISDTNQGDEASVASGPSIELSTPLNSTADVISLTEKYKIKDLLPNSVIEFFVKNRQINFTASKAITTNSIYTLLDNQTALEAVSKSAKKFGFVTEIADDLGENPIEEGCHALVNRLVNLHKHNKGKAVALISGGEFKCPVRGAGIGGRNLETVLRCLIEIEKKQFEKFDFAILSGGTDGIDGNSSAAGAIADQTSFNRAKKFGLDPNYFLENSDSYNFFRRLGDEIVIGATATNVRDIRILLAN